MRFASIGFRLPREGQTCSMVCRVALFGNPILLADRLQTFAPANCRSHLRGEGQHDDSFESRTFIR